MFSRSEVALLSDSVDSQISIVRRKYNAEKNEGIRSLIATQIADLESVKVSVNNPKLVTKP